ncbi:MAG: hypothetical protein LBG83_00155 [Oscillospiraceae bacterium]|jgi:glycerophosphoryl diester phosphodiesterase|nr:hypothetical protein [Oscillospiraceae bacterium]
MSLVISHRGANRAAPENTLPAFQKSLELHVDGFENDVHMTRDGCLVVCHDDSVDRTSNGKGLIADHTLEELRALDFGGWFSPAFAGTKIPTLEEWFAICGGLKVINVELKRAPDGSTASAAAVVALAKQMGLFSKLILSSFELAMLQAALAADAGARVCQLFAPVSPCCERIMDDPLAYAKANRLYAYHPFVGAVSKEFIDECHSGGVAVNPWTVNLDYAMTTLRDWGADGVITDEPALAMEIMYG